MPSPKKKNDAPSAAKPARAESKGASAKAAEKDEKATSGKGSRAAAGHATKNGKERDEPPAPPPPPRKSNIDTELLETIRLELMRKKAELGANISSEVDEMREASEGHHLADMDDLGGDAHDEETAYKIIEIESAALDQINYALDRLASGTFGFCEACEQAIAAERLKALPFANLCIDCKRQQELGEQ
jgi:RNA polymerase-binding protein DksA